MKRLLFSTIAATFLGAATVSAQETASRWWQPYSGEEANGKQVLGFWHFESETELASDSSANGLAGKLRGSKWSPAGKFAGCIEGGAGYPVADEPHGFRVPRSPVLAPGGAFSLEMWIRPKPAEAFPADYKPVLADCKYVTYDHAGFMWSITKESSAETRRFQLEMGLGARSENWFSDPFPLEAETWHHVAFVYDGAGTVTFFFNGEEVGRISEPAAPSMAAPVRDLVIGDRFGSLHRGFPGWIDEVRLCAGTRDFRPARIEGETDLYFDRIDWRRILRRRRSGVERLYLY